MTDQNNKGEALKPIKQWLEDLPEPYRSEALEACDQPQKQVKNVERAILFGFQWSNTEQGSLYWDKLHNRSLRGEFDRKEGEGE